MGKNNSISPTALKLEVLAIIYKPTILNSAYGRNATEQTSRSKKSTVVDWFEKSLRLDVEFAALLRSDSSDSSELYSTIGECYPLLPSWVGLGTSLDGRWVGLGTSLDGQWVRDCFFEVVY